jgi:two-component system response regulator FixJ
MTQETFPRIHIIDDDELVRARMSYLFFNHGYSTEIYSGGREFFCDARVKRGCILLDICMPDMDGYEVQEELSRLGNTMPVVVMSAYCDISRVVRAMRLGAVDFIAKPSSHGNLFATVDRALASVEKAGERHDAMAAAATRLDRLSRRQREILQGLLDGLPNKGIAERLGLSPRTVEMHRAKLKVELGVTSLSATLQLAIDGGMTDDSAGTALGASTPRPDSRTVAGA